MIITRNQLGLSVKTLLLISGLMAFSDLVEAKTMDEQPPPWAARSDLPTTPKVVPASTKATQAPQAASSIETWYKNRQGRSTSKSDSVESLQDRAEQGDREAAYALALLLRSQAKPNPTQSIQWQEKAAKAGLPEAQYGLGVLYANGEYVKADASKATYWFEQAAQGGHEMAKLALGNTSQQATQESAPVETADVNAEPAQAVTEDLATDEQPEADNYTFNADADTDTEAVTQPTPVPVAAKPTPKPAPAVQATIAPQPVESAPEAALQNDEAWVDEVATQPQVEQNTSEVELGSQTPEQIQVAAERGDRYAQLMLGALYEDSSQGRQADMQQAAFWYEQAAKQNYPKAQHNLALLYEDGRGVAQDYKKAVYWYQKAAKAGFSEAQNNLAVLYIMGNGVTKDRNMAEKLLRSAVAQDNENAKRNLSMLLQQSPS
ncbi:SEL1-like repeat protein [Thiolinea disciformis]|uniref:SEL1-like repeat protein n=1 Tax=Thiolinea disciformis TaxID=125614 RepID=UPI0003A6BF2F|nr:SEL1-like repeat protein [Thiolinea disciformis]